MSIYSTINRSQEKNVKPKSRKVDDCQSSVNNDLAEFFSDEEDQKKSKESKTKPISLIK